MLTDDGHIDGGVDEALAAGRHTGEVASVRVLHAAEDEDPSHVLDVVGELGPAAPQPLDGGQGLALRLTVDLRRGAQLQLGVHRRGPELEKFCTTQGRKEM